LNEGNPPTSDMRGEMSSELTAGKLSSQGGFLRQPVFDSLTVDASARTSNAGSDLLEKFNILLSEAAWPSIEKCLMVGKTFIDHSICQVLIYQLDSCFITVSIPSHPAVGLYMFILILVIGIMFLISFCPTKLYKI